MITDPNELVRDTPKNLHRIFSAPAEQMVEERCLLYSLVYGLKPKRILEIGTHFGGTATIFCAALDDIGDGIIIGIDPEPMIPTETMAYLSHRFEILTGKSPDEIQNAREKAGGNFDFVLVDGDHSYEGVKRDINGLIPHIEEHCHIVFHDSHNNEISKAIEEKLDQHKALFVDCGELSSTIFVDHSTDPPTNWGGLRLLRSRQSREL